MRGPALNIIAIALGGAGGSVLRFLLGVAVQRRTGAGFPYGTLVVNVIGCFIMGILIQRFAADPSSNFRALLIVGFCGGFTTFSAFSGETIALLAAGANQKALLYVTASVLLSLLATAAGILGTRALAR